jgi:hypothetical protein
MPRSISRPVLLLVSFILLLGLYYPSLNGGPIWDDYHNIFYDSVVTGDFSYWTIFRDFAWPISVSAEKLLYGLWKTEYFYYHLLNLLLHFLNSYLLLKALEKINLPYSRLIFVLFLLHPSNVISVSWMVQLKTLLCFTFAISALLFLTKALDDKRFYPVAWISFLVSLLSKSASLPLSLIFVIYAIKKKGRSQLIWTLPFVIFSLYSGYKVLKSEITAMSKKQIESKSFVAVENRNPQYILPQLPTPKIDQRKKVDQGFKERAGLFFKTSHYYFWQVLLPLDSFPVKGQVIKETGPKEFLHIIFLALLIFLNWATLPGLALLAGYVMLSPFLSIFTAPYMTLTWVSEQHMYLALPFFLLFWVGIFSKWKLKFAPAIPILVVAFFSFQTFKAANYYKNDIIFYAKSLQADPSNIPIAYNLAVAYLKRNEANNALAVTSRVIEMGSTNSEIKESKYFPFISELHGKIAKHNLQEP